MFEGLTDEQIAALTDDEIKLEIDRICVERGIKLVPPAPQAPDAPPVLPDVVVWAVPELHFRTREDADAVLAFALGKSPIRIDTNWSQNRHYFLLSYRLPDARVEAKRVFSQEGTAARETQMRIRERLLEAYEEEVGDIESIIMARREVVDEVLCARMRAIERIRVREKLNVLYARYLEIAKGDAEIALGFLKQAYAVPEDWVPPTGDEQRAPEPVAVPADQSE